jgi:hypothetical protein
MKGFGVFVDFALCTGNQNTTFLFKSTGPVSNVEAGGTGVLIKWPASIPGDSERTQISG